ncbi:hypothetical protein [Devosia sp. XK-2]|uniref:hypothetical protein n=1 Tax=Devosia sp. XK-2 TaxID=3126689 RepID=UPI0030CAF718
MLALVIAQQAQANKTIYRHGWLSRTSNQKIAHGTIFGIAPAPGAVLPVFSC